MGISHGDKELATKVSEYIAKNENATCGQVRAMFALSRIKLARLYAAGVIIPLPEEGAK